MIRNKMRCLPFFLMGVIWLCPFQLHAEEDVSSVDQSVKKVGVAWNIAEDRQIENDGGLYQPEGLDKYMKRLFEGLSDKIDRLAEQNQRLEQKIDSLIEKNNHLESLITQPQEAAKE